MLYVKLKKWFWEALDIKAVKCNGGDFHAELEQEIIYPTKNTNNGLSFTIHISLPHPNTPLSLFNILFVNAFRAQAKFSKAGIHHFAEKFDKLMLNLL